MKGADASRGLHFSHTVMAIAAALDGQGVALVPTAFVAKELGLSLAADPTPELNTFVRSDQFSFVRAGVPALFMRWGTNYEDKTPEEVKALAKQKLNTIYHKVGDEFDPTWSWDGMRLHAQISFLLGMHVAQQEKMPEWKADSRFKKERGKLD